jgi:hypothetical protein
MSFDDFSILIPNSGYYAAFSFHPSAILQPASVHTQAFKTGLKALLSTIFQPQVLIHRHL